MAKKKAKKLPRQTTPKAHSTKALEGMVRVKVLIPYESYKKGDVIEVRERKVRDSARLLRKGFIKPI